MTFGVGEPARVAAPADLVGRVDDGGPGLPGGIYGSIHLFGRSHVAGQGDAGEALPIGCDVGVAGQGLSGEQREPGPAQLKVDHRRLVVADRQAESIPVETRRPIHVGNGEGDDTDVRLHESHPVLCQAIIGTEPRRQQGAIDKLGRYSYEVTLLQ